MSKYHPKSKPSAYRPQAPSVTCGDSSLPEGAMGAVSIRVGQGSNDSLKATVRIVSGDSPQLPPGGSYGGCGY